jgi:hypothetical protein
MTALQRISITAITALILGMDGASAGELPKYEIASFPISAAQILILGSSDLQEQWPARPVTLGGMPAFRDRIAVVGQSSDKEASGGEGTQTTN